MISNFTKSLVQLKGIRSWTKRSQIWWYLCLNFYISLDSNLMNYSMKLDGIYFTNPLQRIYIYRTRKWRNIYWKDDWAELWKPAHPLKSYNFRIIDDPALLIVTADNIKFELKIKNSEGGLVYDNDGNFYTGEFRTAYEQLPADLPAILKFAQKPEKSEKRPNFSGLTL